jgi:DNA-binding protein HU-beta
MNKQDLISFVAQQTGLPLSSAKQAVEATIDGIKSGVKDGENRVALVGFGTFSKVTRAARVGVNPKTKAKIQIPAKPVAKFKPSKEFNGEL